MSVSLCLGGVAVSYTHLDVYKRQPLNRRMVESLIKSGALDSLGAKRSQMLSVLEQALEAGKQYMADKASMQLSLFDMGMDEGESTEVELPDLPEFSDLELLAMEKDMLGFFVSGHPLEQYQSILKNMSGLDTERLPNVKTYGQVKLGGVISGLEKKLTKHGDAMAIFNLEDMQGAVRCVMFPRAYEEYKENLAAGAAVLAVGKVKHCLLYTSSGGGRFCLSLIRS